MQNKNSRPDLPIYIAQSKMVACLLGFLYTTILIGLSISNICIYVRIAIVVLLVLDYCRVINTYVLAKNQYAVVCLHYDCGYWLYQLRNGRCYRAKLQRCGTVCTGLFMILCLRSFASIRYIMIPRSTVSQRNYRLLALHINCL